MKRLLTITFEIRDRPCRYVITKVDTSGEVVTSSSDNLAMISHHAGRDLTDRIVSLAEEEENSP